MEHPHDQAEQFARREEAEEKENNRLYKAGILTDYKVTVTVNINGKTEMITMNFIHNAIEHKADLWNDSVALEIGEKVEQIIKDKNLLF